MIHKQYFKSEEFFCIYWAKNLTKQNKKDKKINIKFLSW
jgi:hypothetical protein